LGKRIFVEGNNVTNEPSPMQIISMPAEELRKRAEKNPLIEEVLRSLAYGRVVSCTF